MGPGNWRSIAPALFAVIPAQGGFIALGLLIYLIPDMRSLEIFISSFAFLAIPLWFVLPETPRWLLTKGRYYMKKTSISHLD